MVADKKGGLPKFTIKHRGFFTFNEVMDTIKSFFADNFYDSVKYEGYKYKIPSPAGAEYEIIIDASKKVNEYVKFGIRLFLRVFDMREVEIVQDGKKITTNEGKFHLEITSSRELDWQKRFEGYGVFQPFISWLDEFFRKNILKYKVDDYWDDKHAADVIGLTKAVQNALGQEVV